MLQFVRLLPEVRVIDTRCAHISCPCSCSGGERWSSFGISSRNSSFGKNSANLFAHLRSIAPPTKYGKCYSAPGWKGIESSNSRTFLLVGLQRRRTVDIKSSVRVRVSQTVRSGSCPIFFDSVCCQPTIRGRGGDVCGSDSLCTQGDIRWRPMSDGARRRIPDI